jgi:uncharacterized protein (TIGR00290 family)
MVKKIAASWSGGKDSCLALWKAIQKGYKPVFIYNAVSSRTNRVSMHGIRAQLILSQAQAMQVTLLQKKVTEKDYEGKFLSALRELREKGIKVWVFGDINLWEHKKWVEDMCQKEKVKALEPLWQMQERDVLEEFLRSGFQAVVTSAQERYFSKDWVGCKITLEFIEELATMRRTKDVTFCGEHGEYHTFVYDGPLFKWPVRFKKGKKLLKNGHWFIDLYLP